MVERNDGLHEDNVLQNQFTAYLLKAIRNATLRYMQRKARRQSVETSYGLDAPYQEVGADDQMMGELSLFEQIACYGLHQALCRMGERELYILFAKALQGKTYAEIGLALEMPAKSVSTIYYRMVKRLRDELRGGKT